MRGTDEGEQPRAAALVHLRQADSPSAVGLVRPRGGLRRVAAQTYLTVEDNK
jgi:hypothetical protein